MVMRTRKIILLVDDEPEFVEMVQMRLEANGYQVLSAHTGAEAITQAVKSVPDLILLDWMMPGMDGREILRHLRVTPGVEHIPVVMLTARGESRAIFKAQESGATDYLIKPCDSTELLDMVKRHA